MALCSPTAPMPQVQYRDRDHRTHGTLRIANVGAKNLLNIVDEHGSREEYYPDFMSRWHGGLS